ncbi:CRISPR-associated endonuclease Cas1 [Sphingomonas bacterium]|uniref:CRISPR-associated endonuclease Cas1 n=1 Tax=Sphingomonas bacterium TaxID=1895847 RepID=UPI001575A914|nr:CRISPR-associated endonuclease Cas1 [Sphingomonas bacterium]
MYQDVKQFVGDDIEWAERSAHWIEEAANQRRPRRLRQRNPTPLILCGHGVSLRIEHGALIIRDGFTHYPQQQTKYRYYPGDLETPTRILLLDGSGTLSFDVLSWLAEQGVALARVKWTGEVATVASGTGYAADRDKLRWQNETRADNTKRLGFAADLIRQKVTASIRTLENHIPASRAQAVAIEKAKAGMEKLTTGVFHDLNAIFAIEGECASAYFAAGMDCRSRGREQHVGPCRMAGKRTQGVARSRLA